MVMLNLCVDFLTRHEAELSYFEKKSKPPTFSLHRFAQNRQMIIEILQTVIVFIDSSLYTLASCMAAQFQ